MGIEFELKYRATPEQLAKVQASVTGQTQHFAMHTTYYDTPDGALSARHYTLRQRWENETSICTLKFPVTCNGRGEFEVEAPTIQDAIPELCKLSQLPDLPILLEKGITPVCGAKFDRIAITLTLTDTTLELALDQGILYGGGREIPLCELEIELKDGSQNIALGYGAVLEKTYGFQPETASKFRRALALARGE